MIRALLVVLLLLVAMPAKASTDVWLFYGAGFHGWSSGIDRIARIARTFSNIGYVGTYDDHDTQIVYEQARSSPNDIVLVGYSCGVQSAIEVAKGLERDGRNVVILAIQPSFWCGDAQAPRNVLYAQNTWSPGTWGFGSKWLEGDAARIVQIERRQRHLEGDDDLEAQRDVLSAIYAFANPSRRQVLANHLGRTTTYERSDGRTVWLQER